MNKHMLATMGFVAALGLSAVAVAQVRVAPSIRAVGQSDITLTDRVAALETQLVALKQKNDALTAQLQQHKAEDDKAADEKSWKAMHSLFKDTLGR